MIQQTEPVGSKAREGLEDIQKAFRMPNQSVMDSKKFRRSKRLQSILGRMRDSQDDELDLVRPPPIKTPSPQTNGTRKDDKIVSDGAKSPGETKDERVDKSSPRNPLIEEGRQEGAETREEVSEQQREEHIREQIEHIREQINVAVMGSIADPKEPNSKQNVFSFAEADLNAKSQKHTASPKSPLTKPSSPRRDALSPRGGRKGSPKKALQKKDSLLSESSNDQKPKRKSRTGVKKSPRARGQKSKPVKKPTPKLKSASSEESESSDSSGSEYSSESSTDGTGGYSTGSSLRRNDSSSKPTGK